MFDPRTSPVTEAGTLFSYLFQGVVFPEAPKDVKKRLLLFLCIPGIKKREKKCFSD